MFQSLSSAWLCYRSDHRGFSLGTSLLVIFMLCLYNCGIQASLTVGPGGDLPRVSGNCVTEHADLLVVLKPLYFMQFFPHVLFLRCVAVCLQSRREACPACQRYSPAASGAISGASLGNCHICRPLRPDNHHIAFSLHPAPLCR